MAGGTGGSAWNMGTYGPPPVSGFAGFGWLAAAAGSRGGAARRRAP